MADYRYGKEHKYLGEVAPYQPGGYTYKFELYDSLDLELDKSYYIIFRRGKKKLLSERFRYEDYELKRNNFEMRIAHEEHRKGINQVVSMSGKDENNLNY